MLQGHRFEFRDSLMVRMDACRVSDRGSIPRRGGFFFLLQFGYLNIIIDVVGNKDKE